MPIRVNRKAATAQLKADRIIELHNLPGFFSDRGNAIVDIGFATGADTASFWIPWSIAGNNVADSLINVTFPTRDNASCVPGDFSWNIQIPKDIFPSGELRNYFNAQGIMRTYSSFAPRGGVLTDLGNFFLGREDVTIDSGSAGRRGTVTTIEDRTAGATDRGVWNVIYFGPDIHGGSTHSIHNKSFVGFGNQLLYNATSTFHDANPQFLQDRYTVGSDNLNILYLARGLGVITGDSEAWHANNSGPRLNLEFKKIVHVFGGGASGVSMICEYEGVRHIKPLFDTAWNSNFFQSGNSDSRATKVGTKFYFMFRFFSDQNRWNHSPLYFNHNPSITSFPCYQLLATQRVVSLQNQALFSGWEMSYTFDRLDRVIFASGPSVNGGRRTPQCMFLGNTYDFNAIDASVYGLTQYGLGVPADVNPDEAAGSNSPNFKYRLGGHTIVNNQVVTRPIEQRSLNSDSFFVNPAGAQKPGPIQVTTRGHVLPGRYKIPDTVKEADIKPISGKREGFTAYNYFYIEKGQALYEAWGRRAEAVELEPFEAETIKNLNLPEFYRAEILKAFRLQSSKYLVNHLIYFYDSTASTVDKILFTTGHVPFIIPRLVPSYNLSNFVNSEPSRGRNNSYEEFFFSQRRKYLDREKYVSNTNSYGEERPLPGQLLSDDDFGGDYSPVFETGMLFSSSQVCIFSLNYRVDLNYSAITDGRNNRFYSEIVVIEDFEPEADLTETQMFRWRINYFGHNPFFPAFRSEDRLDETDGITPREFLTLSEDARDDIPGKFREDHDFIDVFNLTDGSYSHSIRRPIKAYFYYTYITRSRGGNIEIESSSMDLVFYKKIILPVFSLEGTVYCIDYFYKEIDFSEEIPEGISDEMTLMFASFFPGSRKMLLPAVVGYSNGSPVDSTAIVFPFKRLTQLSNPVDDQGMPIDLRIPPGVKLIPDGINTGSNGTFYSRQLRRKASDQLFWTDFDLDFGIGENYTDDEFGAKLREVICPINVNISFNKNHLGNFDYVSLMQGVSFSSVRIGDVTYFIYNVNGVGIYTPSSAISFGDINVGNVDRITDIDYSNLFSSSYDGRGYYILPYFNNEFDFYRAKLVIADNDVYERRINPTSTDPAITDRAQAFADYAAQVGGSVDFPSVFRTLILDNSISNPRVGFQSSFGSYLYVVDPEAFDINSKKRVFYFSEYYRIDPTKNNSIFNASNFNIEYRNKFNANIAAVNAKIATEYPDGTSTAGFNSYDFDSIEKSVIRNNGHSPITVEAGSLTARDLNQSRFDYRRSLLWGVDPSSSFQSYRIYSYSLYNQRVAFLSDEDFVSFTDDLDREITLDRTFQDRNNAVDPRGYLRWMTPSYLDVLSPDFNGIEPFEIIPPSEDKGIFERIEERDIVPKDGVYKSSDTGVTNYLSAKSVVQVPSSGGFLAQGSFWGLYQDGSNRYLAEYTSTTFEGPGGDTIPEEEIGPSGELPGPGGSPGEPGPVDPTETRERDATRNTEREGDIDDDINTNYVPTGDTGDAAKDKTIIKNYVDASVPNYVTYDKGELVKSFIQMEQNGTMHFNRGIFILPSEEENPTLPGSSVTPLEHHEDNFRLCVVPADALRGTPLYVGLEEEPFTINIGTSFTRWATLGISRNIPIPYTPSLDLVLELSYSDGIEDLTTRPPHPLDGLYVSQISGGEINFRWMNYHNIFRFFEATRVVRNYYADHWCTYLIKGDVPTTDLPIPSFRSKDMYATEANFKDFQYISDSYPENLYSYSLDNSLLPKPQYAGQAANMLRLMPALRDSSLSGVAKEWPKITYRRSPKGGTAYYVSASYPRLTKGYYDSDPVTNPTVYRGFVRGQYFTGYYHHDMYDADDAHLRPTTFIYACIKGARLKPAFKENGSDVKGDINRYKMQLVSDTDNSYKGLIQRVLPGLGYVLRLNAFTQSIELIDIFNIQQPSFTFTSDEIIMQGISYDTARQNSSFIFENEDMLRGDNTLEEFRDAEINALEQGRYIVFNSNAFLLGTTVTIPTGTWTCPYERIADHLSRRQDRYSWEVSNCIFINDQGILGGPNVGDWVRIDSELIPNETKSVIIFITSKTQSENTTQYIGIHFTN